MPESRSRTRRRPPPGALLRAGVVLGMTLPLLGLSCGGSDPEPITPGMAPVSPVRSLYYSDSGAIQDSLRLVIRDASALRERWEEATEDRSQKPALPTIDFEAQMVLLVSSTAKRVGDEIRVDSVRIAPAPSEAGGEEEVMTVLVTKVDGCSSFDQSVWPLQIVRVTRFDGEVRFVEQTVNGPNCGSLSLAPDPRLRPRPVGERTTGVEGPPREAASR